MEQLELKIQVVHPEFAAEPNPCLLLYGKTEGERCRDCAHLWYHGKSSRRYYKCALRTFTRGPGSDHLVGWQACGRFERGEL